MSRPRASRGPPANEITAWDILCGSAAAQDTRTTRLALCCVLAGTVAVCILFQWKVLGQRRLQAPQVALAGSSLAGVSPELSSVRPGKSPHHGVSSDMRRRRTRWRSVPWDDTFQALNRSESGVASIIAMDLRKIEVDGWIDKLNGLMEGTDVFICTDRSFEKVIGLFDNLHAYRFAEDDGGFENVVNDSNMIQWWRLQQCWELVRKYEERYGFRYRFYFKIRSDCGPGGEGCPATLGSYEEITRKHGEKVQGLAFCRSDYAFGAATKSFERIATLFSRIGPMYWQQEALWHPLDYDLLLRCDWQGYNRFHWLNYPAEALKEGCCDRWRIAKSLDDLKAFSSINRVIDGPTCNTKGQCNRVDPEARHQAVTAYPGIPGVTSGFASEKAIVLDLLLAGIEIHDF